MKGSTYTGTSLGLFGNLVLKIHTYPKVNNLGFLEKVDWLISIGPENDPYDYKHPLELLSGSEEGPIENEAKFGYARLEDISVQLMARISKELNYGALS